MVEALLDAAKALVQIVTPLNLAVVSFIEAIFFPYLPTCSSYHWCSCDRPRVLCSL